MFPILKKEAQIFWRLFEHHTILKILPYKNKLKPGENSSEKLRIAVLGLNPHAGDNGLLGSEEQEIIMPAIEQARKMKILVFGPFPADG